VINIREILPNMPETNVIRRLRRCTENDFISRGYSRDLTNVNLYFCPDMDIVSSRFILNNGYSSHGHRISFAI
jgi:hypothetical protein